MTAGAFAPEARAAIYEVGQGRCIGCGRVDVTAQHRRARGMGGNRRPEISLPSNGLPLCGSGTSGCHGWTERHPIPGALLGWRLEPGQDGTAPFWTRFGWRRWWSDDDAFFGVEYVDVTELDRQLEREGALAAYRARPPGWR